MKTHTFSTLLFWVGLTCSAAGFLIGQANRIPFVFRIVSPTYWNTTMGQKQLLSSGTLGPEDKGFNEVSAILKTMLYSNKPGAEKTVKAVRFTCKPGETSYYTMGKSEGFWGTEIIVSLSNGMQTEWNSKWLKDATDKLREKSLLWYATPIFVVGCLIQILSRKLHSSSPPVCERPQDAPEKQSDRQAQKEETPPKSGV
jgi:hypothetical protein